MSEGLLTTPLKEDLLGLDGDSFASLVQSVAIQILHRPTEGINASIVKAAAAWGFWGGPVMPVEDQFSGVMDVTRCNQARTFMRFCEEHPQIETLVMLDNDEEIGWMDPYKLALWALPVVSAVVCFNSPVRGPTANFLARDSAGRYRFPTLKKTKTMPRKGLLEVGAIGTGFLAIHKEVFGKMSAADMNPFEIPEEARREAFRTGQMSMGEDIAFSKQCTQLGIPLHVDLSVHAIHDKIVKLLWPEEARTDESIDSWRVNPEDFAVDV